MKCKTCGGMNCLAHGGPVDDGKMSFVNKGDRSRHERGVVTQPHGGRGKSLSGHMVEAGNHGEAKRVQRDALKEQRQMPKPKLQGLAEGGEVMDQEADLMDGPDKHAMHDAAVDDELMDMACGELAESMKSGDIKGIREALKAIILSCKE